MKGSSKVSRAVEGTALLLAPSGEDVDGGTAGALPCPAWLLKKVMPKPSTVPSAPLGAAGVPPEKEVWPEDVGDRSGSIDTGIVTGPCELAAIGVTACGVVNPDIEPEPLPKEGGPALKPARSSPFAGNPVVGNSREVVELKEGGPVPRFSNSAESALNVAASGGGISGLAVAGGVGCGGRGGNSGDA